jgi:hypothetical protein
MQVMRGNSDALSVTCHTRHCVTCGTSLASCFKKHGHTHCMLATCSSVPPTPPADRLLSRRFMHSGASRVSSCYTGLSDMLSDLGCVAGQEFMGLLAWQAGHMMLACTAAAPRRLAP